ncbi:leucyl aminopeptidase family protein [Tropicimonas sp. S265A]|uniref:leucyl aminopeptidase family protein n=1 Tax=Tropicimonas sp. S265A TaxID=3415134 RepID=UPI003C7D97A2
MTSLTFADADTPAIPVHVVPEAGLEAWQADAPAAWVTLSEAQGFSGKLGQTLILPGQDGAIDAVLAGYGTEAARARKRFALASVAAKLPAGTYRLAGLDEVATLAEESLGWLLSGYKFTRYAGKPADGALLQADPRLDAPRLEAIAAGEVLTRDLINTPANDMGPEELEAAAQTLADRTGATCHVIRDGDLLAENLPLIHTVGRASPRRPRLIDLRWGGTGPKLTLVGKGVCFDTGGLNLKPGGSMALMKKDMGGSATVLGLAQMIVDTKLPVQLRVLIPAVENAVSGAAFRPGDVLTARNGLTVEINNTDAEGRLVLADALALAAEDAPDLIVSMATLTGAARVAVGPDLAPYYTTDPAHAAALSAAAHDVRDPVWQLPFHAPYEDMIEPGIADLDNAPSGGFAGSITAALFLRRFTGGLGYMHFDIYGWQPSAAPARPKGGVGQGARALLAALPKILNL